MIRRITLLGALTVGLLAFGASFFEPQPTSAAVFTCDETGLNALIAAGNGGAAGPHTFSCVGNQTITITSTKTITNTFTIDGANPTGQVTISGGDGTTNNFRMFEQTAGGLTMSNLTLTNGRVLTTITDTQGGAAIRRTAAP